MSGGSSALLVLILVTSAISIAQCSIHVSSSNTVFGHAIKNGPLPPFAELTTFEHNCTLMPCVVTQLHIPSIYPPSGCPWDWENGRLRFYIDGEMKPSIDISLLEIGLVGSDAAQGVNHPNDGSPFGFDLFGKTAVTGGVYTTMRIPFMKSIRTTIEGPQTCNGTSIFWFIIRGIENLPVELGGTLVLPDQAKLTVYRNDNVSTVPYQFLTVASAPADRAGAIVSVFFQSNSSDYNFLEACVRFYPNGASSPIFLSSGTEDYFLSASYFDEGMFKTPQSGVTYKADPGAVAMYKIHESRDFLLWHKGMTMTWRNMEDDSCPYQWPWPPKTRGTEYSRMCTAKRVKKLRSNLKPPPSGREAPLVANATYGTLVFMYTWPADESQLTFSGIPTSTTRTRRHSVAASRGEGRQQLRRRLEVVRQLSGHSVFGHHTPQTQDSHPGLTRLSVQEEDRAVALVLAEDPSLCALIDAYQSNPLSLFRHIRQLLAGH